MLSQNNNCDQPELRKEEMSNLSKIKSSLEGSPFQREATDGHFGTLETESEG